jgi:hypothetical protein
MKIFTLLANIYLLIIPAYIFAQDTVNPKNDTSYYKNYPRTFTTRLYFAQPYTAVTLKALKGKTDLQYKPNTTRNIGVGATYHNISINLAYGFGFLNNDKEKGETKYLDLQGHFYSPKWTADWFGQFYKGFHLYPHGYASVSPDNYYYRADEKITLIGLAVNRVFNSTRFSYRASMIQNEWQKKSAGSLLMGAAAYYGIMKADSAWVPVQVKNSYEQADINNVRFFNIGPEIGYAYTLVVRQHFFATGSLILNLNLNFLTETGAITKDNKTGLSPAYLFKMAAGYNSSSWNLSANWTGNQIQMTGVSSANKYLLHTGDYRIILAKKITPKAKKHLSILDRMMK